MYIELIARLEYVNIYNMNIIISISVQIFKKFNNDYIIL